VSVCTEHGCSERIGDLTDTHGVTQALYRTEDGRLAMHIEDGSRWQGEPTVHSLQEVVETGPGVGGDYEALGRECGFDRPLTLHPKIRERGAASGEWRVGNTQHASRSGEWPCPPHHDLLKDTERKEYVQMDCHELLDELLEYKRRNEERPFWEMPDPAYDPVEVELIISDVENCIMGGKPSHPSVQYFLGVGMFDEDEI